MMIALKCEMCGSPDLIKQDGIYVCQFCGTKYTVEEAKKLLGTVKIDKTEEVEKLLVLARRAQEDNDNENAEKYYGMALQEDPNNWEAVFFYAYFKVIQCTLENYFSATYSFSNNIDRTMKLISEMQDETEKESALDTVILKSQYITEIRSKDATDTYRLLSAFDGTIERCRNWLVAAYSIFLALEKSLKVYFIKDSDRLVIVQMDANEFISINSKFFDTDFCTTETTRLSNEIKAKNPTYTTPSIQNSISPTDQNSTSPAIKSSGCYIATAVYGSYDCPQVWTLRRYRDNTLARTWYGRAFIHTYYAVSPTLVNWFGDTAWFRNLWKPKLDRMVKKLNSEGVEDTPYQDKIW